MKKFIIFFFAMYITSTSHSQEIAIVDLQFLMNNSKQGKKIQNEIKEIEKKNFKIFSDKEKLLNTDRDKLIAQSNVISKENYEKEKKKFNEKLEEYKFFKQNRLKEFNKLKNEKLSSLLNDVNKILIEYIQKNEISAVIDKRYVVITKNNYDITKKIFNILNE